MRCAFEGYIKYEQLVLCHSLWVDLDAVFSIFGEWIALSDALLPIARWHHNIREIAVENCENSEIPGKCLCARLRIDSKKNSIKLHRSTLWSRTQMFTYIYFCASRYRAAAAVVKFGIGSPKMARKEQVCVHQKSYSK